jgi:hypothetical protein
VFALPTDKPDGAVFEVVRFDHSPWEIHVLDDELDLLVQEGIPENPAFRSSGDPMRVWWVDRKTGAKTLLRGPEKDLNLAEVPVSPDHRYVALRQWRADSGAKRRTNVLHILDRENGCETKAFELAEESFSLVGWKESNSGLRAILVTNRWRFDENEVSELYLADPSTGRTERQDGIDARYDLDNPLSPAGKHRFRVGEDELVVMDTTGGQERHFVFHEDDRRFIGEECLEWTSPRYLKFNGQRLALIDVTTMKMCFPASADDVQFPSYSYKFSPDFRWVLYQGEGIDGEGLFIAPVEMPGEE